MKTIGRWIFILLIIIAIFLGYLFSLENDTLVSVTLVGLTLPPMGLGTWLLAFLLLGLILGIIVTGLPVFRQKQKVTALTRKNRRLELEIQQIRSQDLRG
ncbi:lipopolysaccharide assembly protein LapA domain-containing protein [Gilvimarinus xylanilyticus]|uniref:Lipopolysaccharide assembly protein LapA domain-containing protein n=1 Tax=Gilvimarinus xylanilyticus TaxID=2944139 RepID=A0A9X2I3N8_9GAMM|nr:lipopolysaccharide assembly protein LapA domain-containing protein [Gilvimarinus xylanilyticus]MCP8898367.1 lipopolysaccharide assembly protein LapA domain-containing protein [Gilvimarinus xylanilyticus]